MRPPEFLNYTVLKLEWLEAPKVIFGYWQSYDLGQTAPMRCFPYAAAHDVDSSRAYIDPNPLPTHFLGDRNSRAATAERIKDDVAFIAARADDPLEKSFRLLRWI